ncbi:hypothetical protein NL478_26820, partial [Klebsiella pneumoniae]|nr:hypothetical protein [Klebsiella pneumoniae]
TVTLQSEKELCVLPVFVFHRAGSSRKPTMFFNHNKLFGICQKCSGLSNVDNVQEKIYCTKKIHTT